MADRIAEPITIRYRPLGEDGEPKAWRTFWRHDPCGEVGYIETDAEDFDEAYELLADARNRLTVEHVCERV